MMKWLLLLAASAPLFAQCTYTVTPPGFNISASGLGSGQITVATSGTCAWTYATDSPTWISLQGGGSGQMLGPGTVTFAAAASTLPVARQAIIQIVGQNNFLQNVGVSQAAAVCTMTLQPQVASIGVAGGTSTFGIQTNCTWVAASNTSWITLPGDTGGGGSGALKYTASPNVCVDGRTGSISLLSQPNQLFTLNQDGAQSNLTLTPASLSAAAAGVSPAARITITTGVGCPWFAFSDVSWIHFTTPAGGSGSGALSYVIDANTGPARAGSIHFGNLLLPVTQAAAAGITPQVTAVRNAASFATGAVSPGEIVSLFGTAVGPTTGLSLQLIANGTAVSTNLGGAQVFFDNIPAALLYASATQINAVVPYAIAGQNSTQVSVHYQGVVSTATPLAVQAVTPAVFTQDGSGSGVGAIVNQDGTVNARLNPAARGSVIAIYMTGCGVTKPASAEASVTVSLPPFPALAQTPTVAIGGIPVPAAQVVYSGAAPGAVAGLTQIDVVVPQGVTPGPNVSVSLTLGGVPIQTGITLAVQ